MWLRDFIPDDLREHGHNARILTYGYDTKLVGSTSDSSIYELSKQFLEAVKDARTVHSSWASTDDDSANRPLGNTSAYYLHWPQPWRFGHKGG